MWGSGYPASLMLVDKDDTMFYYRIYIIQLYLKVLCLEGDNANQRPHDRSPAKYSYSNCYCAHPDKGKESSQQEAPQLSAQVAGYYDSSADRISLQYLFRAVYHLSYRADDH